MGMMIGSFHTNSRCVATLKRMDGTVVGRITKSGGKDKKKQKKLQYNFKQVSARILQAKTPGNAGQTVIMARSKVAELRQKIKGGEYDDEELIAAIIHAEKMLRVAKKKQRHLEEEEKAKREEKAGMDPLREAQEDEGEHLFSLEDLAADGAGTSREELKQQMERMEQLMEEALRAAERMENLDELSENLMEVEEDMAPEDLELWKKKHRADELKEIVEADMKYLKALFDKLAKEKQNGSGGVGNSGGSSESGSVSLEIFGMQMPVPEPEITVPAEGGAVDVSV